MAYWIAGKLRGPNMVVHAFPLGRQKPVDLHVSGQPGFHGES